MSKTAEEILSENVGRELTGDQAEVLNAMHEFAAQEVEAYKELIRYEIAQLNSGLSPSQEPWDKGWAKGLYDAIKIIDTVK